MNAVDNLLLPETNGASSGESRWCGMLGTWTFRLTFDGSCFEALSGTSLANEPCIQGRIGIGTAAAGNDMDGPSWV